MVQNAEAYATAATRGRRARIDAAIQAALDGDWKRAAEENKALLDSDPRDVEAANRLGKALTELGKIKQAIEAYRQALSVEPGNAIARKNLARLEGAKVTKTKKSAGAAPSTESPRRVTSMLESSDRAAEFVLNQPNTAEVSKHDVGDRAQLEPNPRGVAVKSLDNQLLGYIEPRAGLRLRRMIEGGNRYEVIIRAITDDGNAVVHIRETYKHPSLVGQASFLPSPETRRRVVRAYTKSSVIKYDRDEGYDYDDESEEPDSDTWRGRSPAAESEDDAFAESGFSTDEIEIDDEEIGVEDEDGEELEESDD